MIDTRITTVRGMPDVDPYIKLAAGVILAAMTDAAGDDPEAVAFLGGAGCAPFWFGAICPQDRDVDEVRELIAGTVNRG